MSSFLHTSTAFHIFPSFFLVELGKKNGAILMTYVQVTGKSRANILKEESIDDGKRYIVQLEYDVKLLYPIKLPTNYICRLETVDEEIIGEVPIRLMRNNIPKEIVRSGIYEDEGIIEVLNSDLEDGYSVENIGILRILP